jgi:hypothetical protein
MHMFAFVLTWNDALFLANLIYFNTWPKLHNWLKIVFSLLSLSILTPIASLRNGGNDDSHDHAVNWSQYRPYECSQTGEYALIVRSTIAILHHTSEAQHQ